MPVPSLVTDVDPLKLPLAPLAGAVKFTITPLTGLPPASFTRARNATANAVFTGALWGVPAVAVMLAGGPGLLVRPKLAGAATPETVAVAVKLPATELAVSVGA